MKYIFLLLACIIITRHLQAQQMHMVYFRFNKALVTSQAEDSLQFWLSKQPPSGIILVKGFTDTRGSRKYNLALSARRANAVAERLRLFCSNCTFLVQSFGEDSVASAADQRQNRRVKIVWNKAAHLADTQAVDTSILAIDTVPTHGKLLEIPALKKIYFVPDMAVIETSSLPYLTELASILRHYSVNVLFEIRGHVNAPGKKFEKLSEDRAKEVYLHLIDLGVPPDHLRYRGMGIREMAFPHPKNEEEMRKNIRVDIVVFQ